MFVFRLLKKLIFLVLLALFIWWGIHYKVQGKTLYQVTKGFLASGSFKEGVKDFKMFFGGLLKSVGEEMEEDVSEKDQKALDKLIKEKAREKENGSTGNKKL